MSGAASRRRGHGWECLLANELSKVTGKHIVTGRFFGLTYGADLVTVTGYDAHDRPVTYDPEVVGWSVEAKADKSRKISKWLRQADDQKAPGLRPVVLWTRWHPSAKRAYEEATAIVLDSAAPRGWWEMPIATWVEGLTASMYQPDVQEVCDQIIADRLADGT